MTDLYLKFLDAATAQAALYDGETQKYRNIDVVGLIVKDDVLLSGWHVNVRLADDEDGTALEQYAVDVATPVRVWF